MTDTLERVKTYQQFIGGEFVDAADGRTADVINPANDEVIANVPASSQEDVNRAVDAAAKAFETWKKTTPQDRSLLMLKVADALEANADKLGRLESANAGKPVPGGDRRDRRLCRPVPLLRRRVARHGRARRERVRGRPHLDHPARPDRRRRLDRALELPVVHGVVEARARACDRQHGRAEAVGPDAVERPGVRRDPVRDLPGRRRQRPVRVRRRHRRRPRHASDRPDGLDHRRHGHRQAHRPARRRQRQAAPPGAWRQGTGHRLR